MGGSQACPQCGAAIAADATWCSRCGLQRGASPDQSDGHAAETTAGPDQYITEVCRNCGASLALGAAWCGMCGQSIGAPLVTTVAPAPYWGEGFTAPRSSAGERNLSTLWRKSSRGAKAGIGATVVVAILFLAAIGASSGTSDASDAPSEPATTTPLNVAAGSLSSSATASMSPSATAPSASLSASPTASSADPDDEASGSAGASFPPNATGVLPPTSGASSADRLPGEPDPSLTPGALNPVVTQATIGATICVSGWTATIRPSSSFTTALKVEQIGQYGYTDTSTSSYEEDHLISLELGGAPADPRNLWPEPYAISLADGRPTGAHTKDGFETKLKSQVCAGAITLAVAQSEIGDHWVHAYYGIALTASPTIPTSTAAPTAHITPRPSTPAATSQPAALKVQITSLPASINHGANATLVAVTSPGATCSATVTYASGTVSTAAGLKTKPVADSAGTVSWTWKVGTSTKAGTSTAKVTCSLDGHSASASKTFTVS